MSRRSRRSPRAWTSPKRRLPRHSPSPDTQNAGLDQKTCERALTDSIEEVLSTLKEREARILRLYFGLDGQEPMTLEEIGSMMGITRERVRQIKEKALARLRHVSRARALQSFHS